MNARRVINAAAALGVVWLAAGCGLINEGAKAISATTTIAGQAPGPVNTGNAPAVACLTEFQTVEMAVTSYELLVGVKPTTEAEMIPDYLYAESELFDISPTGEVIPAPGSGC